MNNRTLIKIDGQNVWANAEQVSAVATLLETRKGGVAAVKGYRPSSDWIERPTQNIQFISRVDYGKMLGRKKAALESLSLADVRGAVAKEPKLAELPAAEQRQLFSQAVNSELASIDRTESGDRSDAHRQGHDANYINMGGGVKVHLVTEKKDSGPHKDLKRPVLTDGYPTIDSIMVNAFFLNVTTVVEGERKVVNSKPLTLMKKAVRRAIDRPGVTLKTLSLKEDNFEALHIDHQTIIPEGLEA